ncbi:hypothetical protein H2199_008913 [Coniosporium tulheliwenetii]|uniref:Uncharacterized protein n=1 Tax=Coniosporium tulheliwenetii TaxID=3383036 RepID=A0ACC2YH75_9PEZI|nr:hypothetical protein H2199_008913 [Cladosporium sp. JES 115]
MAPQPDTRIVELIHRAAFEATTPQERCLLMRSYYNYLLASRKVPEWFRGLETLSQRLKSSRSFNEPTIPRAPTPQPSRVRKVFQYFCDVACSVATTAASSLSLSAVSAPQPIERDYFLSIPNEILERILSVAANDAADIDGVQTLLGVRYLLTHKIFTFHSSQADRTYYADTADIEWQPLPNTKLIAPPIFYPITLPYFSSFQQQPGSVLSLPSLSHSTFHLMPDPLALVTRFSISIELAPLQILKRRTNLAAAATHVFTRRRVSHPFVSHQADNREVGRWLEAELTAEKARYHMGVLAELPFRNLQVLKLAFVAPNGTVTRYPSRMWNIAVARWIGRYLHDVNIVSKARLVTIVYDPAYVNIVTHVAANGVKPWIATL